MNTACISGYVKKIGFRADRTTKHLYADVVMDVVDDDKPGRTAEIYFTDRNKAKKWRQIKTGDFVEVTAKIRPALGFTKNGNIAHECTLDPRDVRLVEGRD